MPKETLNVRSMKPFYQSCDRANLVGKVARSCLGDLQTVATGWQPLDSYS